MKKKKEILFITPGTYPHMTGGLEIFNYYLKHRLKDEFDVSYLAYKDSSIEGVKWKKLSSTRPTKYLIPLQTLLYLLFHPKIKMAVVSYSTGYGIMWFLYSLIRKILRRDYIAVIHNGKSVATEGYKKRKYFFDNAYKVIAVSEDIKKNYDAAYSVDCKVIYPLIPFTEADKDKSYYRAKYHIPADCNVISLVGSLKEMKNPQRIIEALHLFDKEELARYRPYVVYAGDGPMRGELEYLVEEKGLSDHVGFLGLIPNSCVREIMAMTDIYLISSDFEGTSVSLLEAMFNSKAIVASDVPGLQDMIENGKEGLLYDVKSPEQLRKCLIELMDSKSEAERFGKAARHRFEASYDYSDVIEEYKSMLK